MTPTFYNIKSFRLVRVITTAILKKFCRSKRFLLRIITFFRFKKSVIFYKCKYHRHINNIHSNNVHEAKSHSRKEQSFAIGPPITLHPFTCIVTGCIQSGKTGWVNKFLENAKTTISSPPERIMVL